ncbi:MAG: PaaI family thioesterase [Candidatus Solibacter usitatus]|nr:PaaI family thioesterase [Candidatus Solibacter usitatus]
MTFTDFLELRVTERRDDGVTIECQLKDFFFNPDGTLHGGLIATVADEAVWYAIMHLVQPEPATTTVELKVNYLRAVRESTVLRAKAKMVKTGRTLCVGTVELMDEQGTLCAIATVTYMLLGVK